MNARMLLFIPAYRCAPQIPRVLAKFKPEWQELFDEILVIDNRSPDDTVTQAVEAAKKLEQSGYRINVLRNTENVSLGGTHKVAFNYALDNGYHYVAVLHGDDQGDVQDLAREIARGDFTRFDYYLGARFMKGSKLVGYSRWRIFGNLVFNFLFSLVVRRRLYDLGSGINIFSVRALQDRFYLSFPNRLTFNYYFTLRMCADHKRFAYFPHTWSEDDQISNLKLFRAVKEIIFLLMKYAVSGKQLFARLPPDNHRYSYEVVYASA